MKGRRFWKGLLLSGLLCSLSLTAAASPVADVTVTNQWELSGGAAVTVSSASAGDRPQVMYTIEADPNVYELMIGGPVWNKSLVQDMTPIASREAETVAAVNGDHFSFKTGIPMGMSISDGEIVTSPVPAYNADEYYFHALGITADGKVLTGENPTLYMQYTINGDHVGTIDRINRTRENWEGGQICLFTPRYGEKTGTNPTGVEFVIRVDEGMVGAQSTMKGTVVSIDDDGDAAIEEGHVVLSISLLQLPEVEALAVGDELEFLFTFEQEEWNDVTFAVGGNRTAVANGEVQLFDYTVGAFTAAAPRTALGVKADGTIVLAAADGRSETAGGLTVNEMATYLAEDLGCEHAILLDGGGSTAVAALNDSGVMATINVPSETRPVGNGVLLVKRENPIVPDASTQSTDAPTSDKGGADSTLWTVCIAAALIVVAAGTAVVVVVLRKSK